MIKHTLRALTFWVAFMGAHAWAQYAPDAVLDRGFQGRVLDVGEQVKSQYQAAWRNAHNGSEPSGTEFVRRWALALRSAGYTVCVNGKRGSETLSQDVLAFPVTSGWARDTSGRYAGRIMVVDVIVGAGASGASISFGPDTSGADGRCIDPYVEPSEGGTSTPDPRPPTSQPPPTQPAPTVDLGPVLAAMSRIEARLAVIESRPSPSLDLFDTYVDDMIGRGPADDPGLVPNHITDMKQRLDVIRVQLEQLTAWLRSRRALGF